MAVNKRKLLQSAQKHQQKGALDKALKDYQAVLKADPKDSNVRLKIGDIHLKQGKKNEAITAYLKVADQFMRDGFDAKAVALYKQITKIDSERLEVYAPLAELYERLGLARDALRALQTAADAHYREGRKKEALDLLRRMASLDPSNTVSRLKVAELLRQEERTDEALDEYEAAAAELERRGEDEERARVLEKIVEIEPERGNALEALARAYAAEGRWAEAESAARRRTESAPDEPGGWEVLGEALRGQGREDEAPEAYRKLAEIYRQRGDEDHAREIMQRYVSTASLGGDATEEPVLETDDELVPETGLADPAESEDEAFGAVGGLDLGAAPGAAGGASAGGHTEEDPNAATASQLPPLPRSDESPASEPAPAPEPARPAERARPAGPPTSGGKPPSAAEASASGGEEGDLDQLLAEANVYLRYGKHERAVESLRAALRVDPRHRGALERLGEALSKGGDTANAAEALRRAGERAREEGDEEGVAAIRARLEPLDPQAAQALAPPQAPSARAPEPAAPGARAPAPAASDAEGSGEELELGDIDIEIDAGEEPESEAAAPAPGAGDEEALELGGEEEIDVSGLVDAGEPDAEPGPAAAPASDAAASEERAKGTSSSTTPQQIVEELEEADFYYQQGLYDEAEPIYRRVLQLAPGHPQAHLRLGEIEAARSRAASAEPAAGAAGAAELDECEGWEEELDLDDAAEEAPEPAPARPPARGAPPEAAAGGPGAEAAAPAAAPEPRPAQRGGAAAARGGSLPQAEVTEPSVGDTTEPFDAESDASGADLAIDVEDAAQPGTAPGPGEAEPEPAEAGAFDLAAELSGALDEDDSASNLRPLSGSAAGTTEEEGFEQVFAAFKQGVSKELDASDFQAHYDLGIAYREMGLLEDAIGEFRVASGGEGRRLAALHMMGLCALDLGRAPDAAAHIEQALSLPDLPDEQRAPLQLDLGRALEAKGELARAWAAYEAVAAIDPEFQQVQRRLEALARREAAGDAGGGADEEATEALESFDDLFAEDEAGSATAAEPEPAYESFDDLLEEDEEEEAAAEPEPEPGSGAKGEDGDPGDSGSGGPGRGGRPRRRKISFV